MHVNVKISGFVRKFADQQETIEVTGNTVDECLTNLESRFPEIKEWLHDEDGNLQNHIWLVVNGHTIYSDELNTSLNDGDEILILLAIGGG